MIRVFNFPVFMKKGNREKSYSIMGSWEKELEK